MSQQIEHRGRITHIDEKNIQVQIIQVSACSSCHAKAACTASDTDEKYVDIPNNGRTFELGELVKITGHSSIGFLAVLLAFVVPFLLILLSIFVLGFFTDNEALSGTIALSVLIPYYLILSLFNKKLKNKLQFFIEKEVQC